MAASGRRKTPECQRRLSTGEDGGRIAVAEQMGELVGLDERGSWTRNVRNLCSLRYEQTLGCSGGKGLSIWGRDARNF